MTKSVFFIQVHLSTRAKEKQNQSTDAYFQSKLFQLLTFSAK